MNFELFQEKLIKHIEKAYIHHPNGYDRIGCFDDHLEYAEDAMKHIQSCNDRLENEGITPYVESILNEEMREVCYSVAKGDYAQAIEECLDAIAVLYRTIEALEGKNEQ